MEPRELQHLVSRTALQAFGEAGFALAGSGALREHGVIDRPTLDVDLFTSRVDGDVFDEAAARIEAAWRDVGLEVVRRRRAPRYAQYLVGPGDGSWTEVDLAVDWRGQEPATMDVGPVLDLEDAIANKISALYGRGAARDFLDVDAIRSFERYADEQLLQLSEDRDAGFDRALFAHQLQQAARIEWEEVTAYGVSAQQWADVQERSMRWAEVIAASSTAPPRAAGEEGANPADVKEDDDVAGSPGGGQDRPST